MPFTRRGVAAGAACVLAAAVYAGSLGFGFVYDDWQIVVGNPVVRFGSWAAIFSSSYWSQGPAAGGGLYRPLTLASYALNARWAGLEPWSFHLVNVLLHAANAALTAALALAVGLPALAAGLCGAAFAVLPIHTEAVDSVVGRAELLAAFFALSAWLCLYRAESRKRLAAGLALFAAALLSKESAAAMPAALALSELCGSQEAPAALARRRAPVWLAALVVIALYLEWRSLMLGSALTVAARPYFAGKGPVVVWLTMARFFLAKWLAPMASGAGLCAEYSRAAFPDSAPGDPAGWLALAAAAGLAGCAAWDFARRRRPLSLGVLVLLVFAAPLSNLLVPMDALGAERTMYLPSVGFCLAAAALAAVAPRRAGLAAAAALLCWWSWKTLARNPVWRSDDSFWEATAVCAPGSLRVDLGVAERLDAAGRHAEARERYRRVLAADPSAAYVAFALARSFSYDHDDAAARRILEPLLRSHPDPRCWGLLGNLDERAGRPERALEDYRRALALDPYYAVARRNLGMLLFKQGRVDESHAELERYLALQPAGRDAKEVRAFLDKGFRRIEPGNSRTPPAFPSAQSRD